MEQNSIFQKELSDDQLNAVTGGTEETAEVKQKKFMCLDCREFFYAPDWCECPACGKRNLQPMAESVLNPIHLERVR